MRCSVCDVVVMTMTGRNYYCPTCHSFYEFKNCDMPFPHVVQYGWICPRCGKVNSPDTHSCDCSSGETTITTGSTISVPDDIKISLTENTSNYRTQFNKVDTTSTDSIEGNYDPTITLRNNK